MTTSSSYYSICSVCKPSFLFVPADVLLDMRASGSELGWLTSPNEEGVSIFTTGIFKTLSTSVGNTCVEVNKQKKKKK